MKKVISAYHAQMMINDSYNKLINDFQENYSSLIDLINSRIGDACEKRMGNTILNRDELMYNYKDVSFETLEYLRARGYETEYDCGDIVIELPAYKPPFIGKELK